MRWRGVTESHYDRPTVLELDGVGVVRLIDRVDGTWFAVLDYHLGHERSRKRDCTSLEAGRRGAELWAQRHAARLARETAEVRARWVKPPCIGERPSPDPDVVPEPVEVHLARQAEEHRRISEGMVISPRRPRRRR